MIQKIIEHINTEVTLLNSFKVVNGLCEYIEKPKGDDVIMKFPALYKGGDQLAYVTNYDFRSGFVFHVTNGETAIEQLESPRSNREFLQYTTPLRLVAIVSRNITGTDNNYSSQQLANNLIHSVEGYGINSLRSVLNLSKINSKVTSYSTDASNFDVVFENVDIPYRHDLSIVIVNYEIVTQGYKACFINYSC